MKRVLSISMAAFVLAASLGAAPVAENRGPKVTTKKTSSKVVPRPYQVGEASWYGKAFHGRTTASGEDFDMFELTAAHRRLPLGTMVKVTNLRNGKSVIVRINDRGPYVNNRIMDLSYGAARMLEFRGGLERVQLDLVTPQTVASAQKYGSR